jgi:hypothetical protein
VTLIRCRRRRREHVNMRIAAPDGVDIADNDVSIYLRNDD